jgi:hypothetical protein
MNKDNAPKEFQILPWGKEIDEEVRNTLRRGKNGQGIRDTNSWGVDFTQELQDSTDESRNCQ